MMNNIVRSRTYIVRFAVDKQNCTLCRSVNINFYSAAKHIVCVKPLILPFVSGVSVFNTYASIYRFQHQRNNVHVNVAHTCVQTTSLCETFSLLNPLQNN